MSAFDYQVVYGNQLADDLHNLFPDLIYNSTRFTNVQDVLQYMQARMRNRFDLFSLGRSMVAPIQTYTASLATASYPTPVHTSSTSNAASASATAPPTAPTSTANPSTPQTRSMSLNPPVINSSRVYRQTATNMNPISLLSAFEMTTEEDDNILSNALLTNLLTPFFRSTTNPIGGLEPVIVRPTQAQIDSATEVFSFTNQIADNCTICQDEFCTGNQVRKINSCGHQFHKNCIDQWFERNVRCPVCRYDIRGSVNPSSNSNSDN